MATKSMVSQPDPTDGLQEQVKKLKTPAKAGDFRNTANLAKAATSNLSGKAAGFRTLQDYRKLQGSNGKSLKGN